MSLVRPQNRAVSYIDVLTLVRHPAFSFRFVIKIVIKTFLEKNSSTIMTSVSAISYTSFLILCIQLSYVSHLQTVQNKERTTFFTQYDLPYKLLATTTSETL